MNETSLTHLPCYLLGMLHNSTAEWNGNKHFQMQKEIWNAHWGEGGEGRGRKANSFKLFISSI